MARLMKPAATREMVNFTCYGLSVASKPISTLINLETGQPAFAFAAIDWNAAWSMPGILALTVTWTEVMEKPSPSLSMFRFAVDLLRHEVRHAERVAARGLDAVWRRHPQPPRRIPARSRPADVCRPWPFLLVAACACCRLAMIRPGMYGRARCRERPHGCSSKTNTLNAPYSNAKKRRRQIYGGGGSTKNGLCFSNSTSSLYRNDCRQFTIVPMLTHASLANSLTGIILPCSAA
jgi:hypothetical protein